MSEQPPQTSDAVEVFIASLRQRAVPLNTIKSYAHDLHLFVQAVPADLTIVTAEQIQAFLTSDERHSTATRHRRYSTLCTFYHWLLRHEILDTNPMSRLIRSNKKAVSRALLRRKLLPRSFKRFPPPICAIARFLPFFTKRAFVWERHGACLPPRST